MITVIHKITVDAKFDIIYQITLRVLKECKIYSCLKEECSKHKLYAIYNGMVINNYSTQKALWMFIDDKYTNSKYFNFYHNAILTYIHKIKKFDILFKYIAFDSAIDSLQRNNMLDNILSEIQKNKKGATIQDIKQKFLRQHYFNSPTQFLTSMGRLKTQQHKLAIMTCENEMTRLYIKYNMK